MSISSPLHAYSAAPRQKLYLALGETLDGRLVFVVFRRLSGGMIRVITARGMDESERRLFRRK